MAAAAFSRTSSEKCVDVQECNGGATPPEVVMAFGCLCSYELGNCLCTCSLVTRVGRRAYR